MFFLALNIAVSFYFIQTVLLTEIFTCFRGQRTIVEEKTNFASTAIGKLIKVRNILKFDLIKMDMVGTSFRNNRSLMKSFCAVRTVKRESARSPERETAGSGIILVGLMANPDQCFKFPGRLTWTAALASFAHNSSNARRKHAY